MRAAGLQPNKQAWTWWVDADKAAIVAWVRHRRRKHESLRLAKVLKVKHARALLNRCDKLFGSWNAALLAAGAKPARENSPWPRANRAAVVIEIRQRKRTGKSLIANRWNATNGEARSCAARTCYLAHGEMHSSRLEFMIGL